MRRTWFLILCSSLTVGGNASAQASSICEAVLIPTEEQAQSDYRRMQAFMYNNAEYEYDRLSKIEEQHGDSALGAEASYKLFSAEYRESRSRRESKKEFSERVRQRLTAEGFSMSESDARSYSRRALSDKQVEAWIDCVTEISGSGAILLSPYDIDKHGFTLRVDRVFPRGVPSGRVELEVTGGDIGAKKKINELYLGAGAKSYHVSGYKRSNMVKVTANMPGFTDRLSVDLAPLKAPTPKPFKRAALSDIPEIASGDIRGGLQKNKVFWQPEVWVAGGKYDKALGIHPDPGKVAWAEYRVPSGATWFKKTRKGDRFISGDTGLRLALDHVVISNG